MLSYRHAFHAGNHADVLKHSVLIELLDYFNQKDKPYWYIDTHAGAGAYALDEGYAAKNAEYRGGVGRLWERDDLPEPLARYVDLVRDLNPDGRLRHYPGSPLCADRVLREEDRLRLFELHPTDNKLLRENFGQGRRVKIEQGDGFAALKAVLPPPPRRALVLIDPPYEDKKDYQRVVDGLQEGLKRFATGAYVLWYPQLQRPEVRQMLDRLKQLPVKWLHVALTVQKPSVDGFGMHGSGLFIINPPWLLHASLQKQMPYLVKALGLDHGARFTLEQSPE